MNYVRHTKAIDTLYCNMDELIANKALENKYIIMFGTSKIAGMIIYYMRENGIDINMIIDNDKKRYNEYVFDVQVFTPDVLVKRNKELSDNNLYYFDSETSTDADIPKSKSTTNYQTIPKEDIIILIASSYQDEMITQLINMGFDKEKNILKIIDLPQIMSDYSFIDRTGYIELSNDEIRASQLKVLRHLKKVCTEYNIPYFLCGGTLLGAVRHKGYIPWDDDIDVVIEIHNLKRLVEIMKKDNEFTLVSFLDESSDYYDECSLMFENSTICDSNHFPMQLSMGISIDIFPICAMPDDEIGIDEYVSYLKKLEMNKWGVLYDKNKLMDANKQMVDYLMKFDYHTCNTVGNVLSRYLKRDIWKKDLFESSVMLEFENEYFKAPQDYDTYLTQLYGTYMELPPIEQRKSHHYFKAYKAG